MQIKHNNNTMSIFVSQTTANICVYNKPFDTNVYSELFHLFKDNYTEHKGME